MRAENIGEHLLRQCIRTWDERELEFCSTSGSLYWLAQLLRSTEVKDLDIPLAGERVTPTALADALEEAGPLLARDAREQGILVNGVATLRELDADDAPPYIDLSIIYEGGTPLPAPL